MKISNTNTIKKKYFPTPSQSNDTNKNKSFPELAEESFMGLGVDGETWHRTEKDDGEL